VQENLIDGEEKSLEVDTKYLKLLGFSDGATKYYPTNAWNNSSLPVIVTAVSTVIKSCYCFQSNFQYIVPGVL
jgi:hypothetical protein